MKPEDPQPLPYADPSAEVAAINLIAYMAVVPKDDGFVGQVVVDGRVLWESAVAVLDGAALGLARDHVRSVFRRLVAVDAEPVTG